MINWKKEILTIPNLLSLFRLVLIPVYMLVYLQAQTPSGYVSAGIILALSCLTDMIDGKIARAFHQITNLGKFLDPLADKLTQFALLICLGIRYDVLWTVFALFLLKEMFQLFAGILTARKGYILKNASASRVQVFDRPVPGAKTAVTDYQTVRTADVGGATVSLVRAQIHTGRTHQIRAQMSHAGWPLIGDDKYGDRELNARLHAKMPSLWCEELTLDGQVFRSEPAFPLWKQIK